MQGAEDTARYQHMWASHPEFKAAMVKESWEAPLHASPLCVLVWQTLKSIFFYLFSNLSVAEDEVLVAQQKYDLNHTYCDNLQ